MREVMIKSSTTENHKRKNLSIVEIIDMEGFVAKAEKKYVYYVSEQNEARDPAELKYWMDSQAKAQTKKDRHVTIRKIYDQKTGIGQMLYRVIGSFYVVQDLRIFAVVFMHSIKYDMVSERHLTDTL